MKLSRIHCWLSALLLAGMFFVSPIPHTTGLRNLFLLGLIVMLAILWRKGRPAAPSFVAVSRQAEILAIGMLTLWMVVQILFGAVDRSASFGDFFGEWLGSLLVACLGFSLARRLADQESFDCSITLVAGIVVALFAHAAWMLVYQTVQLMQTGRYELGSTPFANYASLSTPINMAFALLASDFAARWTASGKLFPWSGRITQALLFFTAVAVVAVKARNGVITVFAVLLLLGVLVAWLEWRRTKTHKGTFAALLVLVLAAGLFAINFRSDPRWATFAETVAIAWDIKAHKAWLDKEKYPLPSLSSGESVEASAYDRIAWARVALEGIASRPFGFGYGVGAFGRYVEDTYDLKNAVSSHSGLLDFTLASGIPGLALFTAFCALLFRRGWLAWIAGNPWGLALILTLANFCFRIVLDGHFGSFRLKMVALLLGVLYWLTIRGQRNSDIADAVP